MSRRTTFVQLDLSGGEGSAFLMTTVLDDGKDGFKLVLSDGECVWTGKVSGDDMDDMKVKMKMDFNTYVEQTVKAFTKENIGDIKYLYQLKHKKDRSSVEFVWKKYVPAEDITFQLGSTALKRCDSPQDFTCKIFNHCIEHISQSAARIQSLETDNERLSQERVNALKRLEKCVIAKEELEKDLYSKFVAVLNAKKEKLRSLKDTIESNGTVMPSAQQSDSEPEQIPSTSRGTSRRQRDVEEGKDSDAETTDEETKPTQSKRAKRKEIINEDDSLVLDDSMEESIKPTVVKRQRRQGGNKKNTPSKPVLPKVSSKGSTPSTSTSRRSSMRKSTTGSRRSADNEDVDDLLADF